MDHKAMMRGTIPWTIEGFQEAVQWLRKLQATPKDDWDLTERSLNLLDDATGEVSRLVFNPFSQMNQLTTYLFERYHHLGTYHGFRFMQIQDFLSKHHGALTEAGLAKPETGEGVEFSTALLQALCELPYSKRSGRRKEWRFDFQEVKQRALQLIEENPDYRPDG